MKISNPLKLIACFLTCSLFLLSTTSCEKKLFKKVSYEGHVYDHAGNPASGIKVILSACSGGSADKQECGCANNMYEVGSATTDASGSFHIEEKAASTGYYSVKFNGVIYSVCNVRESKLKEDTYTKLYLH